MAEIQVPMCDEMAMAILEGVPDPITGERTYKDWTTRSKKLGEVGDTFTITRGPLTKRLRIIGFKRMRLEEVAQHGYRHEGCVSPEDFIRVYSDLHPKKGWTPEERKWVHIFEEVNL